MSLCDFVLNLRVILLFESIIYKVICFLYLFDEKSVGFSIIKNVVTLRGHKSKVKTTRMSQSMTEEE